MLVYVLSFIILVLAVLVFILFKKASSLEAKLEETLFTKRSQSVKYGKITEQFVPFLDDLPFSAENFRFLGSPIDGVAFEQDEIILCEFKASDSGLSDIQKRIKKLVEEKKVKWLEFRLR
ncbi:MAG: Holliday junction resolvase-like protein [archaeon]|jgi:predicted Holliday junction resolvase-like endonuclease|nr:Holliday junction resolvase-like protein [archaeon]